MGANRLICGISLLFSLKASHGSINEKDTMSRYRDRTCSRCNFDVIDKIHHKGSSNVVCSKMHLWIVHIQMYSGKQRFKNN